MFTKVPSGWVEVDREPLYKIGDRVKFPEWNPWRGVHHHHGKVTMVGIYDSKQAGGIPDDELHLYGLEPQPPKLVYAYSINVIRDDGVYTYPGVPEFLLTLVRSKPRKNN